MKTTLAKMKLTGVIVAYWIPDACMQDAKYLVDVRIPQWIAPMLMLTQRGWVLQSKSDGSQMYIDTRDRIYVQSKSHELPVTYSTIGFKAHFDIIDGNEPLTHVKVEITTIRRLINELENLLPKTPANRETEGPSSGAVAVETGVKDRKISIPSEIGRLVPRGPFLDDDGSYPDPRSESNDVSGHSD